MENSTLIKIAAGVAAVILKNITEEGSSDGR